MTASGQHGKAAALGVTLKVNAREKKNLGGLDTVGEKCGAECAARAYAKLEDVGAAEELRALQARSTELN